MAWCRPGGKFTDAYMRHSVSLSYPFILLKRQQVDWPLGAIQ